MSEAVGDASIYAVGGAVQASGGLYLRRAADDELFELCRRGDFGYVLTPRQLGKSSLMVRTAERLAEEGVQSVIIDLTEIGVQVTPEAWFLGLLVKIEDHLMLDTSAEKWWNEHAHQGLAQRMTAFFKEVLLKEVEGRVVVFFDEIDTTLSLSFTDDFYAAIRYFYNARAHTPEFRRLSFVLIGVATPGDLIRDPQRTPFNIGRRVDLTDFTFDEALPLAAGLGLAEDESRRVLGWVLDWTGGHPYLTQRLCRAVADKGRASWTKEEVSRVVSETFLGEMSLKDNNLQFVRDMLTKRAPDRAAVLSTYREALRRPVADEEQSIVKSHLKLSGVVCREDGVLRVRNPIYREVFDEKWAAGHLPVNWLRILTRVAAALIVVLMVLSIPLAAYAWMQKGKVERALEDAESARARAEMALRNVAEANDKLQEAYELLNVGAEQEKAARQTAEDEKARAQMEQKRANEAKDEADKQRQVAEQQRQIAEQKSKELEAAKAEAEGQARLARGYAAAAESARNEAVRQREEAERLRALALSGQLGALAEVTAGQQPGLLQRSVLLARESVSRSIKDGQAPPVIGYQALRRGLALLPRPAAAPDAGAQVDRVAYSDDGARMVVESAAPEQKKDAGNPLAERFYTVRVFDAATNRELPDLRRTSPVGKTALDASLKYMAAVGADGTVSVTELASGRTETAFKVGADVKGLAVSSDGRHVVVNSGRGAQVKSLSGVNEGVPLLPKPTEDVPTGARVEVYSVSLSPDGRFCVLGYSIMGTGYVTYNAQLLDVASGADVNPAIEGYRSQIFFSRDGKYMVASTIDAVLVYDTARPEKPLWSTPFTGRSDLAAAFTRDGSLLAVTTGDSVVELFQTKDGSGIGLPLKLDGPAHAIRFSERGHLLATSGEDDNAVRVWATGSESPVEVARAVHKYAADDFALSPDEKSLLTVESGERLRRWSLTDEGDFVHRTLLASSEGAMFAADDRYLLAQDESNDRRAWDTADGGEVPIKLPADIAVSVFSPDKMYAGRVEPEDGETVRLTVWDVFGGGSTRKIIAEPVSEPMALGPGGKYLAAAVGNGRVKTEIGVFDLAGCKEGAACRRILTADGTYRQITFSPDGTHLALWDSEQSKEGTSGVDIWDVVQQRKVARFGQLSNDFVLFSSKGSYALAAGRELMLWRRDGGGEPVVLPWSPARTGSLFFAFSADERYAATSGGGDNSARVWETATGRLVAELKHDGEVFDVALSERGDYLATISRGNSARVWRVSDGAEVARVPHQGTPLAAVAFSPNSKYLLMTNDDGGAEMWLWRPEDLVRLSCGRLTVGEPDEKEWVSYLGQDLAKSVGGGRDAPCPGPR